MTSVRHTCFRSPLSSPGCVLSVGQLSAESDALRRFGFLWLLYLAFILYGTFDSVQSMYDDGGGSGQRRQC